MGIKSFFHSVSNGIKHGWNSVKHTVSSFAHTVGHTIKSVGHFTGNVITHIVQTPEKIFNKGADVVKHLGDKVVDGTTGVIKGAEKGLFSSIGIPLILLGGGLAYMFARQSSTTVQTVGGAVASRI